MGNFIVSARKYRPARFDEVVGQNHVSQTLKNALQNDHLAHAFLFCGPRGVGKTTCARILAKVLNCQNITEDFEACNECASCQAFNNNASFNITELDAASNNSVEHIRSLVEQVRFQPQQGKYKIFIIDEVHMLSSSAFNAFLKTLEEPPPYAIFILATTEKHKIIPTILSRCQIFDFKRIQVQNIVDHLLEICAKEGIEADKDALHIIAQKADGALRDALSIFDRIVSFSGKAIKYEDVISNLNVLDYDYFFKMTDAFLLEDVASVMLTFDEIVRNGFEPDNCINGLATHMRNLLVCKDPQTIKLLEVSDSLKVRYEKQAQATPTSFVLTALNIANDCDVNYKMARNKRLHTEMALIKMTYINRAVELSKMAPPAQSAEKKNPVLAPPKPVEPKASNATPQPVPKTIIPPKQEESAPPKKSDVPPVIVANAKQPDPAATKVSNGTQKSNAKYIMPKLVSLDTMAEAIEMTTDNGPKELSLEQALAAWVAYIPQVGSPSVRNVLTRAELAIADQKIEITVGSKMAKDMIQQEPGLMIFMRTELKFPKLILKIKIDPSKAPPEIPKPKKLLTVKERYDKMVEVNPLLDEMRRRFDLKTDHDS